MLAVVTDTTYRCLCKYESIRKLVSKKNCGIDMGYKITFIFRKYIISFWGTDAHKLLIFNLVNITKEY